MNRTVTRLERVFAKERAALLKGDIDGAMALLPEKDRLVRDLERATIDAPTLDRIRFAAQGSLDLIDAARQGIAAARLRIEAIGSSMALRTYASDGRSSEVTERRNRLERRA